MAWDWINKIVFRIASEVHKSKIEEFEKRIMEMERKHDVMMKTIHDNEKRLEKLDDKLYDANTKLASTMGSLNVLFKLPANSNSLPNNDNN